MVADEEGSNPNDGANSNDSGMIVHETSNEYADRDKSIIHICPSDNAAANVDLVAFHGRGHALGTGVTIDMAGNINTPGNIHSGTTSFTSDSDAPLSLGGWAEVDYLVSPGHGHLHDFKQLEDIKIYLNNLSMVVPEDKKLVLTEINNKLQEILQRYQ